jgi:hypothetical protein
MLEEAYGKTAAKKKSFMSSINVFVMAMQMSVVIRGTGNCRLQQMMKTLGMFTVSCEVTDARVFRRYEQKCLWVSLWVKITTFPC